MNDRLPAKNVTSIFHKFTIETYFIALLQISANEEVIMVQKDLNPPTTSFRMEATNSLTQWFVLFGIYSIVTAQGYSTYGGRHLKSTLSTNLIAASRFEPQPAARGVTLLPQSVSHRSSIRA